MTGVECKRKLALHGGMHRVWAQQPQILQVCNLKNLHTQLPPMLLLFFGLDQRSLCAIEDVPKHVWKAMRQQSPCSWKPEVGLRLLAEEDSAVSDRQEDICAIACSWNAAKLR